VHEAGLLVVCEGIRMLENAADRQLLAGRFFEWLEDRTGSAVVPDGFHQTNPFVARIAGRRLVVAVEPAASGHLPVGWLEAVRQLEARLSSSEQGAGLVWLPPGAAPPVREPVASAVVDALQRTLASLAPGESGDAALPITIHIRKKDESGAYVTAFGGLSPYWAQFTEKVQGYYHIDSTALHRLRDDEAYIRELIDRVVEASKTLELEETAAISAQDNWRVQRLRSGDATGVMALPPEDETETGAPLRRRLRIVLGEASRLLAGEDADLRVLLLYGHYGSMEGEPVGTALRGQDPALFGALDLIALVADGQVKPLINITRQPLLQEQAQT